MDKEDAVHACNGGLCSHKNERNWVMCRDVDGLSLSYTVNQKEKTSIRFERTYGHFLLAQERGLPMSVCRQAGPKNKYRVQELFLRKSLC